MSDDGSIMPTRVLLVEDHEAFRRFVRAKLLERQDLLLVAETGNGLDAVSRCLELQPSLVLMDIGLPGLNGIEAARRIRALVPTCRIVFLTQESSAEIVHEALNLGASGYVLKAHASNDLMPAIIAAREGRRFVSKALSLGIGAETFAEVSPLNIPGLPQRPQAAGNHSAHFHRDEASLLAAFTEFIEDMLTSGRAVIAITTKPHRKQIFHSLQARGFDVASVTDSGRFVPLDVDETLATFMVDALPDPARFFQMAGELVKKVKATNPDTRVLACGEISPTLWERGNGTAAIQVEHLWDQLARIHDLETICGYMLTNSQRISETYNGICGAHSSIRSF